MKNTNAAKILSGLKIFILAAGLAILVTTVTILYMHGYETKKIIIALVINLMVSHFLMFVIGIIGESFIEDIIKAVIISILGFVIWSGDYEKVEFIRSISLSIIMAAWYPVLMKMLPDESPEAGENNIP